LVNASVFYFNHESLTCNKGDEGEVNHVVEGAVLLANNPGSDFTLVQLNARVPSSYRPFFAGWARDGIPQNSTVIHHPLAFRKKISSDRDVATTNLTQQTFTDALGNIIIDIAPGDAWVIGLDNGTTQPGSSGAPLFNENQRIVGQNSNGAQGCPEPEIFKNYGRFGVSWNIGTTSAERLRDWLDPSNTNAAQMTGYAPQGWLHEWVDEPNNPNNRKVKEGINTIDVGLGNQIFYRAKDGLGINNDDVRTFWWSTTTESWQHGILGTKKITGDLAVGEGNQVFFKGDDSHLCTYSWQNGNWNFAQLSNAISKKVHDNEGSLAVGAGNQIFYRGKSDNEMHIYYWNIPTNTWEHGWLGSSNPPANHEVNGDVVVDKNNNNVFYRNVNGDMCLYSWSNGTWSHSVLSTNSNHEVHADPGAIAGTSNQGEVFYRGTDNKVHAFSLLNGTWTHSWLDQSSPNVYDNTGISNPNFDIDLAVFDGIGGTKVFYKGNDGKTHHFYRVNGNWIHDWVENSWQAPSIHDTDGAMGTGEKLLAYRGDDGRMRRYFWEHDFDKSSANNDYFSMEETPLSPTIPKQENVGNILNVIVRPNPVESDFSVDIYAEEKKEMAQITIYDNMGRQVLFQETVLFEGRNTVELSLTDFHSGIYYVKVMDKNGVHISKPILKL
jgi:hypothetical protein